MADIAHLLSEVWKIHAHAEKRFQQTFNILSTKFCVYFFTYGLVDYFLKVGYIYLFDTSDYRHGY